jgi:hypothetical protein
MKRLNRATLGDCARRAWSAAGFSALLLGSAVGCSGSSVQAFTASGQQATVSQYKTFGVVIPDEEELKEDQMKPETLQRLAVLSVEHMQALGYQVADPNTADMLIGLSPEARLYGPLKVVNDRSPGDDSTLNEHFDAEGTLTVSFVDMHAKQVVLRRVAKARLNVRPGEEQMREIVSAAFEGVPRVAQ